jgi:hypothetical protein
MAKEYITKVRQGHWQGIVKIGYDLLCGSVMARSGGIVELSDYVIHFSEHNGGVYG